MHEYPHWNRRMERFKMRVRRNFFIPAVFVVVVAGFVYYFFPKTKTSVPYKEFYEMIQSGKIDSVSINGEKLVFTKTEDKKAEFETQNPHSQSLKETLLLNGISVKEEKSIDKIISLIFDILFYSFFAGIVIIAFRKFISPNTFKTVRRTGVKFSDIVGMDSIKNDMMQIVRIMKDPLYYSKKGIRLPKGILLEGAPGNGKTLFARALAGEAKINFIPAKATDFESMFMAIGPLKVKLLFKKARAKAPCIVFIDEFDGIGTRRNYSGSAIETENTRIVTALLNELDGFEQNSGILVVAASNSRSALDEALIRPGRFDAKYTVPFPDGNSIKELIKLYSKDKKHTPDCGAENLAAKFRGFSCAQIESVINRAAIIASQDNREEYSMNDIQRAMEEI